MAALQFNGSTHRLKWTTLASALSNVSDGAWTLAVLCKFSDLTHFNALSYLLSSTGNGVAEAGCSFNTTVDKMFVDVDVTSTFTSTISNTANPHLFVISKGAGNVAPRLGWKLGSGGSWTHENGASTITDQIDATMIEIGTWQTTADFFEGHIGVVAWWEGAMSDGNKEALDNNWRTSDWWNSAHGQPEFLVELNVAAASVVDLAGNASSASHVAPTLDAAETLNSWNFDGTGVVAGGPVKVRRMRSRSISW